MTVAVLKPYGGLHAFLKALYPHHAENRHHQLRCNQGMLFGAFKYDTSDFRSRLNADHGKKGSCVSSHALSVERAFRRNHRRCQLILNFPACKVATVFRNQVIHQLVRNSVKGDNLLLRNTGKVVVEGTSVDDIPCRLAHVRRLVNQCGRIACACADGSFSRGENRCHHAGAAGGHQKRNCRMLHHNRAGFHGGNLHRHRNIIRSSCFKGSFVYHINGIDCGFLCIGMGIKYHRVTTRNHSDGIADNRFRRVGCRRDCADYPERSHFHQRKPSVAGPCNGVQILCSGRLVGCQLVL